MADTINGPATLAQTGAPLPPPRPQQVTVYEVATGKALRVYPVDAGALCAQRPGPDGQLIADYTTEAPAPAAAPAPPPLPESPLKGSRGAK